MLKHVGVAPFALVRVGKDVEGSITYLEVRFNVPVK